MKEAHRYLCLIGAINFGLLAPKEEEEREKPSSPPAAAPPTPPAPSDAELLSALAEELAVADMAQTTEKLLRKKLENQFGGVDLTEKKLLLRAGVERFLAGEAVIIGREEEKKQEEEEEAPPPPLCRPGASAVVIGAGPAGLGAALHLSRCGVRVTVLEARGRAGRRAHSVAARGGEGEMGAKSEPLHFPSAGAAVDLGALIVTGIARTSRETPRLCSSATAGRRSDPSGALCEGTRRLLHPRVSLRLSLDSSSGLSSSSQGVEEGGGSGREVSKEARREGRHDGDALLTTRKTPRFTLLPLPRKKQESSRPGREGEGAKAGSSSTEGKKTLGEFLQASLKARLSAAASSASASAASAARGEEEEEEKEKAGAKTAEATAGTPPGRRRPRRRRRRARPGERAAFSSATPTELRLLDWQARANLEYGCAAPLSKVCLSHWNQDDTFGGFGGKHAMVVGGFGALLERAAERLSRSSSSPSSSSSGAVDLRLSTPVRSIRWGEESGDGSDSDGDEQGRGGRGVVVVTAAGEEVAADVAIVTVPLGVLKSSVEKAEDSSAAAASISFDPPLPPWKADAVRSLGFGKLEKVFLEFGEAGGRFWPEGVDFFGVLQPTATAKSTGGGGIPGSSSSSLLLSRDPTRAELLRGSAFMFWDVGSSSPGSLLSLLRCSRVLRRSAFSAEEAGARRRRRRRRRSRPCGSCRPGCPLLPPLGLWPVSRARTPCFPHHELGQRPLRGRRGLQLRRARCLGLDLRCARSPLLPPPAVRRGAHRPETPGLRRRRDAFRREGGREGPGVGRAAGERRRRRRGGDDEEPAEAAEGDPRWRRERQRRERHQQQRRRSLFFVL